MTTRSMEILVGVFVAIGFGALFMLAMQVSNLNIVKATSGYELIAYFENVGGLKVRSPVTVSGVRVGRVSNISYDMNGYQAEVRMKVGDRFNNFPADTIASIYTAGLLGEQYIALEPGADEQVLKNGDVIEFTQSALVLEQIIGKVLVNMTTSE